MKIKVLAICRPVPKYRIGLDSINGFDLTPFKEGDKFTGNSETKAAGIHDVERIAGELYVTLLQRGLDYSCQPVNGSHDWFSADMWIDAEDYDPARCYIVATSAPDDAEYVRNDEGWTVTVPVIEQEEPIE